MRTIELGVTITDAAIDEESTTIFCAPVARDPRCPDCGCEGRYRDTVTRPLTDLPVAGYPLVLRVAVPRYRCATIDCGRTVFNQDLGRLAAPRGSMTRRCARYVLRRLMIDRTTISAIAAELGGSWHAVSAIAMRSTADLVAAGGPDRLDGVRVIGVDEHRWAPRRVGPDGFVTLIIDLTPTHDHRGPARLLDMVEGRSATALASWLAAQPAWFAQAVEVIAMDGFAGYKTAASAVVPDAVTVMDPFHVVALAGAKLDLIRQRVQQQTLDRRGHAGDPLYGIRRIARTRTTLLSTRQHQRLTSMLDLDEHLAVKVAYVIYQRSSPPTPTRTGAPATRDEQAHRFDPPWRASWVGGDRPTRPHPMAPPQRHPRVLGPPRLQRAHRSYQRTIEALRRNTLAVSGGGCNSGLAKHCRSRPLMFSLLPRCQGECGSQK